MPGIGVMRTTCACWLSKWGFDETGTRLEGWGNPEHEQYAAWFDIYAGEKFPELTGWCKGLMDHVAADASERDRERFRDLFQPSARYEYLFWDAAWRQEEWPVGESASDVGTDTGGV
ncbi:MAG: hypothetical protein ABEH66_06015 [Halobacteriales archaeon]